MGLNMKLAKEAEVVAKRLAKEAGMGEALWEMFLQAAYDKLTLRDGGIDDAHEPHNEKAGK